MRWLDFLFWHYYCFFEKHKNVYFGDNRLQAIVAICICCFTLFGVSVGLINTFVCTIKLIPIYGTIEEKLFSILYVLPCFLYLDYRYYFKKSVTQNNYQIFRDRWGEPLHVSKKNMRILLTFTIVAIIGMLLIAIVVGELNRRGLLEGCRLFP